MLAPYRRLTLQLIHWLATEINLHHLRIGLIQSLLVNEKDPFVATIGSAEDLWNPNNQ